jgi:hypothetical protein
MPAHPIAEHTLLASQLQSLTDRLNASDLTVAEAENLRPQLLRLLEQIEAERATPAACLLTTGFFEGSSCPAA